MLEYVFFHDNVRERFLAVLRDQDVAYVLHETADAMAVGIDEETPAERLAVIEACYETLLAEERRLCESDDAPERHVAGIGVTLRDGRRIEIPVAPDVLTQLVQAVGAHTLAEFAQTIVQAVESPDDRPFCQQEPL